LRKLQQLRAGLAETICFLASDQASFIPGFDITALDNVAVK